MQPRHQLALRLALSLQLIRPLAQLRERLIAALQRFAGPRLRFDQRRGFDAVALEQIDVVTQQQLQGVQSRQQVTHAICREEQPHGPHRARLVECDGAARHRALEHFAPLANHRRLLLDSFKCPPRPLRNPPDLGKCALDRGGGSIERLDGFEQSALLPLVGGDTIAALANRAAQPFQLGFALGSSRRGH